MGFPDRPRGDRRKPRGTPLAWPVWRLHLLGNLLDHPKEEVSVQLFDLKPFELGGDLTAVIGRVIGNVPQYRPPRQCESAADRRRVTWC
jgi:hypothetical protein